MICPSGTTIDHAALRVAQCEADLAEANELISSQQKAGVELRSRLAAVSEIVAELRVAASRGELSEAQAAKLNLALLDRKDIEQLIAGSAGAMGPLSTRRAEAQAALNLARTELVQATASARRVAIGDQAIALERKLVSCLTELWLTSKILEPHTRFVQVWRPGDALTRAAVHHQPPNGDLS